MRIIKEIVEIICKQFSSDLKGHGESKKTDSARKEELNTSDKICFGFRRTFGMGNVAFDSLTYLRSCET